MPQYLGQEEFRAVVLGFVEDLMWRALLDDLAFVKEDHAVGNSSGKAHLMCHRDDGHAAPRQLDHHIQYFLDHFRV